MIRTLTTTLLAAGCIALLVATGAAQKTTRVHDGRGGSPHDRTEWTIDGANISITYGRPSVTGREIFGGLQPFGKVWRTGADEATVLSTSKTLVRSAISRTSFAIRSVSPLAMPAVGSSNRRTLGFSANPIATSSTRLSP